MLAFLIGTTILNLFLGYALAVYLMRASQDAEYRPQPRPAGRSGMGEQASSLFADAADTSSSATTSAPATTEIPSAATGNRAGQAASIQAPSAGATPAADGTNSTAATAEMGETPAPRADGSEELDQQLLAGIADFRSQLAKLRSETGQPEEGKRRPVARK